MAGVGGDCFGADKAGGAGAPRGSAPPPRAPAVGGIVGTHDPNYQVKTIQLLL